VALDDRAIGGDEKVIADARHCLVTPGANFGSTVT
jgi:hypothetical protein